MELKYEIKKRGNFFEGKSDALIARKLTGAMWEAVLFLETQVKENLPTEVEGVAKGVGVYGDRGGLRGTIAGEVEKGSSRIRGMSGHAVITGIVGHTSVYGDVIEKGRRADKGMPPKGSLIRWMEVKLGMGREEAEKKEYVFRRSIGKKGFAGLHMFERAFKDNEQRVFSIFDHYGFEIAREL
jgi:hypothetical protein